MTPTPENILPCMEIAEFTLKFEQVDAAMKVMMKHAMANSDTPVCLAIVDSAGNLEAFAKMDNASLFTRRHAIRKAYSAAILGINTSAWEQRMTNIGHSVSENGDPMITYEQGGVVILKNGTILGGIGVGGIRGHNADEALAKIGLEAMNL